MGILDDLEQERQRNTPPDAWAGAEDKLEEWLGLAPEGSMPDRKKKALESIAQDFEINITIEPIKSATGIYRPSDFDNSLTYAQAIRVYSRKIPEGYYAGYIVTVTMNGVRHVRRIAEPVKTKSQALNSPEFLLAFTESIRAIQEFKR